MAQAATQWRDSFGLRDDRAKHPVVRCENISTSAVLDGDEWVINGEKFFISGAGDPRCKIMITMVKTSSDATPSKQQSQILVPKDTPALRLSKA